MTAIVALLQALGVSLVELPGYLARVVLDVLFAVASWLLDYVLPLLPTDLQEFLGADPLANVYFWLDPIDTFIPVYDILGLYMSTLVVVATIRALRWLKSFVPIPTAGG